MAKPPSPLNPFLGSQTVSTPPPVVASVAPTGADGDVQSRPVIQTMAEDLPVDGNIPTPASKWRHKAVRRSLLALVVSFIIVGLAYWWFRGTDVTPASEDTQAPSDQTPVAVQPLLPSEPPTLTLPNDDANYVSENFKAGEIVIGGELQFLVDESEVGALTVENIRGEAFTEKNKQEVKLVVTWTTNKLAQASVRYSKGIGQTERAVDEGDYSYNHSVIISGLDPASTYLYTIDASDRFGNRVKSEPHAVFTGARTVSLFDLIAGAIGEVFGWAVTNK